MSAIALELADGRTISGSCDPQFTSVLAEFRANFAERKEVGASVSITHHGRTVVDLWGGIAKPETQEPWTRDTVSIVYSCTKAATALCLHMLVDQGRVTYETLVGDIWPAFATNGKNFTISTDKGILTGTYEAGKLEYCGATLSTEYNLTFCSSLEKAK